MTPELLAKFELRCGDVHPVRCNEAFHAVTREELTNRIRAHGAMAHGFTSTWYDPARIATIAKAALDG